MKKILVSLLMVFGFVFTSLGSAQSEGFGIYSGFPTWLGVQYQVSNFRLGAGIAFAGLGAGVDYMFLEQALPVGQGVDLSWYAGAGASLGLWTYFGVGGLYIFPHALAGIEYALPGQPFSVYGEAQLGFGIFTGSVAGVGGIDFNGRVGLIFR